MEQLPDDDVLEREQLKSWPEDWYSKRKGDEITFPEKRPTRELRNNKAQEQQDPILAGLTHTEERRLGVTTLICPKCDKAFVKRVSRRGFTERLMSVVYVYPFGCRACGHRFRFFKWGVRYLVKP